MGIWIDMALLMHLICGLRAASFFKFLQIKGNCARSLEASSMYYIRSVIATKRSAGCHATDTGFHELGRRAQHPPFGLKQTYEHAQITATQYCSIRITFYAKAR